jgi:two-component system OmpR family sensor kinase
MIDTASAIAGGDLSRRVDHDDDGTELGQLAQALDDMLGQLEASFDERAAAQTRLEQFVADASHELRTPVTAIRGYAELYRGGGLEDRANLDRAMTRIEQESARMGGLVEDLLLLARLDEHRPLEHETVDVRALAADATSDLQAIEPERPVELHTSDDGPTIVRGDERRLRQVLANLLSNARMHTPAGTAVAVTVERTDETVRIVVADEGPGIAPADQRRIFERFYRTDRSRSRESGGSGLGLSIVAAVVAAHGGTVHVESEPGSGTTFTVDVPAVGAPVGASS